MNITVPVDQYREITCLANTAMWALGFLEGKDTEHCSDCSALDLRHILRTVRDRLSTAAMPQSQPRHPHCP